jgi:hypothetical protein
LRTRTRIPDFDRLVDDAATYDLRSIWGKLDAGNGAKKASSMRIRLLAQQLQFACQTSEQASVLAKEGRFEGKSAPESQTLIVLSVMPQLTIFDPSGENWTQEMEPNMPELCAFVFSQNSPRAPARQASRRQFWPRRGDLRAKMHLNPRL